MKFKTKNLLSNFWFYHKAYENNTHWCSILLQLTANLITIDYYKNKLDHLYIQYTAANRQIINRELNQYFKERT